jgi:hypothetical protein
VKKLKYLNENEEEYEKMLNYKNIGFSDKFKAMIDVGSVHSYCRICLYLANNYLKITNTFPYEENHIFLRERNTFYYKKINFKKINNFNHLKSTILDVFKDHKPVIFFFNFFLGLVWSKTTFK